MSGDKEMTTMLADVMDASEDNLSVVSGETVVMDTTTTAPSEVDVEKVSDVKTPILKPNSEYKDFTLSLSQLFAEVKDPMDLEPIHSIKRKEAGDEDFEKVDAPASPFVSAAIAHSQRSKTENMAATYNTSDDARVDFFFQVMEQTSPEVVIEYLEQAWKVHALDSLKLIASLRDIKDGKGIRQQYQHCLYWLYQYHPETLYQNLPHLLKLGYWKDALHMLVVALFDGFVHPHFAFDDGNQQTRQQMPGRLPTRTFRRPGRKTKVLRRKRAYKPAQSDAEKRIYNVKIAKHYRIENADKIEKVSKKAMDSARFRFAREVFEQRVKYRTFHVRIAQLFAAQLAEDVTLLNATEKKKKKDISLAAKWAPSLEGHFDRYTLIATTIALELARILNKDFITNVKSIQTVTYLARKFYNKEVCVPLRAHLELPEVAMSAGKWSEVNYKRVSSKCMQINKAHFIKHDNERLMSYLIPDKNKVAGATLKPIDIMRRAMALDKQEPAERLILEKQWISLVDDIKKKGSLLASAIAICDVSGSMMGDPMLAALGLTMLTMEQTKAPWNELCITFSYDPQLFHLKSDLTLMEKVRQLEHMDAGYSTNFDAALKLVCDLGVKNNLPQEEMPKILFVFTDMEFNQAFKGADQTNFEAGRELFQKHGYQLPTIVFWNLRASTKSTPVQKDENGVMLLSGFSGQLLAFIMNTTDLANCTPYNFIRKIFESEKYKDLKIYD